MYTGNILELKQKEILLDIPMDKQAYHGSIISHEAEQFVILLTEDKLREVSLDATYDCTIFTDPVNIGCEGRVKERFISQEGRILLFQIQKGFYEKNINEL